MPLCGRPAVLCRAVPRIRVLFGFAMDNTISKGKQLRYVNYLTLVSCLIYGFKTLDSQSVTYFSDILINDLNFTTSQYTSLTSLYYLSYGLSSVVLGILISQSRKRKAWLAPITFGVGLSSVIASVVDSYIGLVACRLLSGFFSGCSLSVILCVIAKNLVKDDYGARNGVINAVSSIIGSVLGPLLFAWMSSYYSWHGAFLLSGLSLIVCALLVQFTFREVDYNIMPKRDRGGSFLSSLRIMFSSGVFVLCFLLGILETAGNLSLGVFIPLYFTDIIGMDIVQKGWFLSLKGIAYIPVCFIVPLLCDRFSMKTVLAATFVLAFVGPFSAFMASGTMASAYLLAIFGGIAEVTVTIYVYMIPRRFLPEHLHAAANGVILGCSVVVGGCIAPVVMSSMIDSGVSIVSIMGICAALFFICIFISMVIPMKKRTSY